MLLKTGCIFLLSIICSIEAENAPVAKINQGDLKGKYGLSSNGKKFSSFTGIPYAKPPVGPLRFSPSEPADLWTDTLDATKSHSVCPQLSEKDKLVIGDEDCLYLNVYTPELFESDEIKTKLPILFYIHGGEWAFGSANDYGPDLLLNKDVILVTINYRLGPLGFFTSGDKHMTGNDGLKDQVLALKWVKENIESFGGDSESITVFGHDSGGASAHYHMLSPLSRGLIKSVIAQSGTALSSTALMAHFFSTRFSKHVAHDVGCNIYEIEKMMDCIKKVKADDLISYTSILNKWHIYPISSFYPVIEPNIPSAFLAEDPIDIIKSGKAAKIPLMTGFTTHEGDIRAEEIYNDPKLLEDFSENFTTLAPYVFGYETTAAIKYISQATEKVKKFYFGDAPIEKSSKTQWSQAYADGTILSGTDATIRLHVKQDKQSVYHYLFGYKGSESFCSNMEQQIRGVCHGDDLLYLFNLNAFPNYKLTDSDKSTSELMTSLWVNFATYGTPTPDSDSSHSVKWEPVKKEKENYYHVKNGGEVGLEENLYAERTHFWRNLDLSSRTTKIKDEL